MRKSYSHLNTIAMIIAEFELVPTPKVLEMFLEQIEIRDKRINDLEHILRSYMELSEDRDSVYWRGLHEKAQRLLDSE